MSLMLIALAVAVWWWPRTRVEHRVAALGHRLPSATRVPVTTLTVVGAPVTATLAWGPSVGIAATIVGGTVAWRLRRVARERSRARATAEMTTALSVMIAEMSVGAPPSRACAAAADELRRRTRGTDGGVAEGLTRLAGRAELGGDVSVGTELHDGADSASWERVAVAWTTADRYGLPMAEMLDSVRTDLTARRRFAERTRAGLAGPRATATVLAGLPILGILLGQGIGADPVGVLFGGGVGGWLLVIGTALGAAGVVWSERIIGAVTTG